MIKLFNLTGIVFFLFGLSQDQFEEMRHEMVRQQIASRGIEDQSVLKAMRAVPRHQFVTEDHKDKAYDDRPLPIGHGQTISQPYIVAFMTQMIKPKPDFKVLEIGTGSGYQAAVLSQIVDEVYTIEIIDALGQQAKKRLSGQGYDNVHVKIGDGYYGWEAHAPYDAIVVTAASETIPPPLIEQLKEGGVMAIPVGSPFMTQYLLKATKKGDDVRTENVMPVRFVPFTRSED